MNPTRSMGGPTGSVHRTGSYAPVDHYRNQPDKKWGDTTSKTGEVSRVFVGSIDKGSNCADIENIFSKYGQINGIDINSNGFAFVQYDQVDDAKRACTDENGKLYNGRRIEVRMFDKSNHPVKGKQQTGFRERSRSPIAKRAGPTGTRRGTGLPPGSHYDDTYGYTGLSPYDQMPYIRPPPGPPPQTPMGNEAEIIVINKDQWGYAEMIESRIRQETGIEYIDMLFLHTPTSLNVTLNDLYERQTSFAIVVSPINEQHQSLTLHVLYNQTEHRNMPLEDALQLIKRDHKRPYDREGVGPPSLPPSIGDNKSNNGSNMVHSGDGKLPEDVAYLLKTVLQEDGPQFLSLQQIDSLIDYFTRERNRLTSRAQSFQTGSDTRAQPPQQTQPTLNAPKDLDKQRETLLDNPHVQAALSSLIQIGALNSMTAAKQQHDSSIAAASNISNAGAYGAQPPPIAHQMLTHDLSQPPRRHPLMGTEIGALRTSGLQQSIPGAPGGLVRYPPPQSYNQYSIKPDF